VLLKPNVRLKIRVSKKKQKEAANFFRHLRDQPRLGLFIHDFRDKRLMVYLHPPNRNLPSELHATKLLEPQRHELNFMLGRFKHDPSLSTLSNRLTRLLQVLPKPADAELLVYQFSEERIDVTFERKEKEFTREHVSNFFWQKGKLLLTIAGEIMILTKNDESSLSGMSTKRYELKMRHASFSASFRGSLSNASKSTPKVKSVLRDTLEYFQFTKEEVVQLFEEMSDRQCKIVFMSLRVGDFAVDALRQEIEENLNFMKTSTNVKIIDIVPCEEGERIFYQIN